MSVQSSNRLVTTPVAQSELRLAPSFLSPLTDEQYRSCTAGWEKGSKTTNNAIMQLIIIQIFFKSEHLHPAFARKPYLQTT